MPSSVVASMEYYEENHTLRIVYVSGLVYEYKNVPPAVFQLMKSSRSKGVFLNRFIKGRYDYEKVTMPGDQQP